MGTFVFIIGIASIALCCQHYGEHDYQRKTHRFSDASGDHDREICSTIFNCYGRDWPQPSIVAASLAEITRYLCTSFV